MNAPSKSTINSESQRYYVMMTEKYGRGVYAERDLKKGESVMYCEVLVLSTKDTPVVNSTDLKDYTFTFNAETKQDCIVLGDGELFNHGPTNNSSVTQSTDANTRYYLQNINNRWMMVFRITRPVNKDEQLFIDYNADVKDSVNVVDEYKTNLI